MTNNPIASMNCLQGSTAFERLLTALSRPHTGHGVVRISAGMVGILLNSRSPRENYDVHQSLRVCLEWATTAVFESVASGYSELLVEAVVLR
jgi:hypothetical protein